MPKIIALGFPAAIEEWVVGFQGLAACEVFVGAVDRGVLACGIGVIPGASAIGLLPPGMAVGVAPGSLCGGQPEEPP